MTDYIPFIFDYIPLYFDVLIFQHPNADELLVKQNPVLYIAK